MKFDTRCDIYYWKESGLLFRLPNMERDVAYERARKLSLEPEISEIRVFSIRVLNKLPLRTNLRTYEGPRHE